MAEIKGLDPGNSISNLQRLEDIVWQDGFRPKHQADGTCAYKFYEGPGSSIAVMPELNGNPSLWKFDTMKLMVIAETPADTQRIVEKVQNAYLTQAA